jgi:hypothetical protein
MTQLKLQRAIKLYKGFKGDRSIAAIIEQIPAALIEQLTGKQLAVVMEAINGAYQKGRASTGAEKIDNDCVWVSGVEKLIEIKEKNAVYEYQDQKQPIYDRDGNVHAYVNAKVPVKVKDGQLVCNFVN